ncbi:MAG: A24 family peptidase [Nanoarchaeota archaeon]|nr:A24 family peptidase [Nanoarchaeota archaeon]
MAVDIIINYLSNLPLTLILPYILALLVLIIGSYTDIKTREVPDWVNFGLIGMGFGVNALFSVVYWKIDFILGSIIGFGIFFAIAWAMFYFGQWGGGDSKMLMGLGAMVGITFQQKFILHFLANAMIVGALYGILWSIYSIVKNRKKFSKSFKKNMSNKKIIMAKKIILVLFVIIVSLAVIVSDKLIRLLLFYLATILVATFYIWIVIRAVENACMLKYVKPQQLTEGDWIAKEIKIGGKYITGPKDLGIEKSKIRKLIELYKRGKVKKILVKEGIPFVPSFFVAYIITLILGNLAAFAL